MVSFSSPTVTLNLGSIGFAFGILAHLCYIIDKSVDTLAACRCDQQELSYRKQIARQLRTKYVDDIHRPKYYTVTLKSRLRVIRGHWKRNHWTDHTRLTISRVI